MEVIAIFAPLFGFLLAGLFGKGLTDKGSQFITCLCVIAAAVISCSMFFDVVLDGHTRIVDLVSWITVGEFTVNWALRFDQLSVIMMCVITVVSSCVHVYSIGYMSHDACKSRFMAYLSLFTFAMLMLVTADNLLQLFFGWEGVGLASYLLIGFWNHKDSANAASMKAFIVNRVGDFGLALGIMATFVVFGSIEFETIFAHAADMADVSFEFWGGSYHALTVIGLLLFMGAVGKSAQLGLHVWLPDAMEGPTPVSALIHAATMVTAGVFLVARFSPLYEYAPIALQTVCIFGGITAFVAATIGMTQFDIKRVIAYSTMSQLGYMFFALGVSAYGAAMFHLVTHAFFKALLFLGAGSVIHAMSDEQDMRNMGGIWKKIPTTYVLMWIGSLALAGVPFFAGYYSKDIILESAWADGSWFGSMAFWLGIAAAFMTAFYSWRLIIMTFHGKPRAEEKVMAHIHESPAVMLVPLFVLAFGALFSGKLLYDGFVGSAHHGAAVATHAGDTETHAGVSLKEMEKALHGAESASHDDAHNADHDDAHTQDEDAHHDDVAADDGHAASHGDAHAGPQFWADSLVVLPENDTVEAAHSVPLWVKKLPIVVGGVGILFAYIVYMWSSGLAKFFTTVFRPLYLLFFNKWYFDEIYNALFTRSAFVFGKIFSIMDKKLVDGLGPDGLSKLSLRVAAVLSRAQSGFLFHYAFIMIVAAVAILSWFVLIRPELF